MERTMKATKKGHPPTKVTVVIVVTTAENLNTLEGRINTVVRTEERVQD
jgi:hypothetical protein